MADGFACNQSDLQASKWKEGAHSKGKNVASVAISPEEQFKKPLALRLLNENERDYIFDIPQSVSLEDWLSLDSQNKPNVISDFNLSSDVSFESLFEILSHRENKENLLCFTSFWKSLPRLARILTFKPIRYLCHRQFGRKTWRHCFLGLQRHRQDHLSR